MPAIIAQTVGDIALGGGAAVTGSVFVAVIVKRQINKLLGHVDERELHNNPLDPPQSKSMCDERSSNICKKIDALHADVRKLIDK